MDDSNETCSWPSATIAGQSEASHFPILQDISDEALDTLVQNIEKTGFGVIPNYIRPNDLEHLQDFAETKVKAAGGEYVGLTGKAAFQGTMLDAIADSPSFVNLIHRIYKNGCGHPPPNQTLYQVLRCINGKSGQEHEFYFHFDSYVVTALLPIIIPNTPRAGHLIMIPNARTIRKTYIRNVIDKAITDNKLSQRLLRHAHFAGRLGFRQLKIVPGNLYLFWGYRSLHANEACDPDQIRATALYHFGDPHAESTLRKFTGKAQIRAAYRDLPPETV
jgi:hypothetical protein